MECEQITVLQDARRCIKKQKRCVKTKTSYCEGEKMKVAALSHVGKVRTVNEDSVLVHEKSAPVYMLVADGMGGHAAGEVASGTACSAIQEYIDGLGVNELNEEQIRKAVEFANKRLRDEMEKNSELEGMGTTLTLAAFCGDVITFAQVGDSRAYHKQNGSIRKVTKDHTYVQHLIDSGVIKKGAAEDYPFKNIITRAVGMKEISVDFFTEKWEKDDIILLCSDGLSNYTNEDLLNRVLSKEISLEDKAKELVEIALSGGGKDNISVILAQYSGDGGLLDD